ncbi:MAG: phosphoribosylformylglycinamidine synthase I [Proteobacteria bacterium]|nr:phosphoribosylformylglycinamidine synthase I [Pseudomonadota bacterium]
MKVAVVMFPGSSGADDVAYIYKKVFGADSYIVWHQEETIGKPDLLVIPGGAAFGDYLRPGALTLSSPIVGAIRKFSRDGGPTIGIGNGFQILCELHILPGILLPNIGMQFINREVFLLVQNNQTPFTKNYKEEDVIKLPMACSYGRYFADKRTIRDLEENGEIVFRFCDKEGEIDDKEPFNGCINSIAAICSRHKNTVGMICHPERACEEIMQNTEGMKILGII